MEDEKRPSRVGHEGLSMAEKLGGDVRFVVLAGGALACTLQEKTKRGSHMRLMR